jgi:predicted nucleic-acid-binding protein
MIAVDTNILVRFLVGDDEQQSKKVYKIFKDSENEKLQVYVALLVILELIWVLESAYKIDRDDIINSLDQMILMPIFDFENLEVIQQFIPEAKKSNFDLSDLLIAHSSTQAGCDKVITFDKKASKHSLFKLLK